jgi:RimJ/RimL family protein N-acetyltransferase
MPMVLPVETLEGAHVRLEPLSPSNKEGLRAALDCDPESWEIMAFNGCGEGFDELWNGWMAESERGAQISYAIITRDDGQVVGATSFLNIRRDHHGVEIGATFIHPDHRSGPVNPETKRLMLNHAFENGVVRAEFMVDVRNARSQSAVQKLGADKEGVLRANKITWTGHVRDTAVFSIIDSDWPAVRQRLDYRLREDFV